MGKITYDNKVFLNQNPEIADINKVTDDDLNEIKTVVNQNDDNVGDLEDLTTSDKSSIVGAINETKQQNITVGGEPAKCGYKIDGKDVYVKRIHISSLPNATTELYDTGIDFANATLVEIKGVTVATNNINIPIPYSNPLILAAGIGANIGANSKLEIRAGTNRSGLSADINIYFTYN